jgi:4-hydroxy 2-oxovalerate aldolase
MDANSRSPILLDCTLRDGGYYKAWDFGTDLINDYLQAMSALGTDYVELGLRSFDRSGFKGGCAYTTDSFIRRLDVPGDLRLGVMVNASELVKHPHGVVGALSRLFSPASESPLTLVRIACHLPEFEAALPGCVWLRESGYVVGVNLMQIADRTPAEIEAVARLASLNPPDVLYFADSMGSLDPGQTSEVVAALRRGWSGPLGIHTHNNMGQALSNSLRAIADGVTWVDGSVTGMGRGAGNVQTEYLAVELAAMRQRPSNIAPLLSVIAKHFKPLQAHHGWGTNTYYYLAGKYGIHPTYIQEMLSDSRFGDEDLLSVIEHLRKTGGKKFSMHALETGRHFYNGEPCGTWAPATVIAGREVLILGPGPSVSRHRDAIEDFIRTARPFVIGLNTHTSVSEDLIDIRAASHPARLLVDGAAHLALRQPLATPASMLPEFVRATLKDKTLLDFGLAVRPGAFEFAARHCVLPTSLVIAYALAIAASGGASRVGLAGFDGYGADDPRSAEVDVLLSGYQHTAGTPPLLAITPTRYKVPTGTVYALPDLQ